MKNYKITSTAVTLIALFLAACSPKHPNTVISNPPSVKSSIVGTNTNVPTKHTLLITNTNSGAKQSSPIVPSNYAIAGTSNVISSVANVQTNLETQYQKYLKGQISKGQMMQSVWTANNQTPQSLYGKVTDQNGAPVIEADVTGTIELIQGFDEPEKLETYKTQTDSNGLFQFTGLKGYRLDANISKDGYKIDYRVARTGPKGLETSSTNRTIYSMWKLKGPEPMIHSQIQVGIPCDGSPRYFDLLTGHRVANGGDIMVRFERKPVNIIRGKSFDWELVLAVPNGGLMQIEDVYPNEAPATGYQSIFSIKMPSATNRWTASFNREYYFKSRERNIFGRIRFHLSGNYEPPPTYFEMDAYINPASSRNLEVDQSKTTKIGNGNF